MARSRFGQLTRLSPGNQMFGQSGVVHRRMSPSALSAWQTTRRSSRCSVTTPTTMRSDAGRPRLRDYLDHRSIGERVREREMPAPPWPSQQNATLGYLIDRARAIEESDGLQPALVWLASRLRRDLAGSASSRGGNTESNTWLAWSSRLWTRSTTQGRLTSSLWRPWRQGCMERSSRAR